MSKNTNCLEGVACPKCGQDDYIRVEGTAVFILYRRWHRWSRRCPLRRRLVGQLPRR